MNGAKFRSADFTARIDASGRIRVPGSMVGELRKGRRLVHVRLTTESLSNELRQKGVTEEEIERIAGLQREPREQAVIFLLSEGALRRSGIARRGR